MEQQGKKKAGVARILFILIGLFAVIQLVPYGRNHSDPPPTGEPAWDSPQTRETFFRVCKNCHSNETEWPWYSNVAPVSWLVQSDVDDGRAHFNVSEWGRQQKNHGDKAAEEVRENDMPPWYYRPMHPESRLTKDERAAFAGGLVRTFGEKKE